MKSFIYVCGCLIRHRNYLPFPWTWVDPQYIGGSVLLIFWICFTPWLLVGGLISYLRYLDLFACSGVQCILWCVCVLVSLILCTLCFQFPWIVHFWLPLRYSLTFICLVFNIPYVSSFSGVSIFDCLFGILYRLFKR